MAALQAGAPAPEGEGAPIAGSATPLATWFGEKLQPAFAAEFIAGHQKYKPRPWLIARMPGFVTVAHGIADGLSLEHGFASTVEPEKPVDKEMAANGEKLIGENGGFNCMTCHGVGTRLPTAVFEAPGINLAYSTERLRIGYYHRWVLNPLRIDPETKMPKFADDEGKTPLTDLYDGDAHAQFEAIRQYLRTQAK
jgi:mono/diheme cytochrome c family protein